MAAFYVNIDREQKEIRRISTKIYRIEESIKKINLIITDAKIKKDQA